MSEPDREPGGEPERDASSALTTQGAPERRALLLDPDLFFAVKVGATLKHIGIATTTVRTSGEWTRRLAAERFDLALVNTAARGVEWEQAIGAARAFGLPVIAYGSHVDTETMAQARAAGATRVIANSKLAADLPAIVAQTLQRAARVSDLASAESASAAARDHAPPGEGS
jgi:DNA-binding NtrC family response regulator